MLSDEQQGQLKEIRELMAAQDWATAGARITEVEKSMQGPHGAQIFVSRGDVQAALGEQDKAGRSYRTAYSVLRYAPKDDAIVQLTLGRAAEKLGNAEEAKEAYQHVLDSDPDNQDAKDGLGRLG